MNIPTSSSIGDSRVKEYEKEKRFRREPVELPILPFVAKYGAEVGLRCEDVLRTFQKEVLKTNHMVIENEHAAKLPHVETCVGEMLQSNGFKNADVYTNVDNTKFIIKVFYSDFQLPFTK